MPNVDINITFLEVPPSAIEIEAGLFTVALDVSGCEEAIQPLIVKMMSVVEKQSRELGARYVFSL